MTNTTHAARSFGSLFLLTTALLFVAPVAAQKRAAARRADADAAPQSVAAYACPMDADVTAKAPGKCRKCGMKLVEVTAKDDAATKKTTTDAPGMSTAPPPASSPAPSSAPLPAAPSSSAGGEEARRKLAEMSAKYFPNHVLLTEDGREVRFYEDVLRGKVVLINFMFTTCAGVCSPMTANMAKVQSYLGERVGRDVVMLSISVDPATDTPEVLKAYAAKHKAGPGWTFLTGKKENVEWVLYKLGGYTADKAQHSSVLIIGNEAAGEWMKTHAMAKPSEIAAAVLKMVAPAAK